MNITDETRALDKSMDGVRDKTRALNDSLQKLTEEGFDRLSRAAAQTAQSARSAPAKRDNGQIMTEELAKLMRQELTAGLAGIFGARGTGAGSGMQVVIHNNAGVQVSARETEGMMDQKQMEITIDQMVANSLLRGRQTSGVMRTLFGLAPSLLGR